MTTTVQEEKPITPLLERHIQTVIVAILLALLIWTGNTLLTIKDDVTTLKVQVGVMQVELRSTNDDRFRASDWRREKEVIDDRFRRMEVLLERHIEDMTKRSGVRP